jgi:hypothetical protein
MPILLSSGGQGQDGSVNMDVSWLCKFKTPLTWVDATSSKISTPMCACSKIVAGPRGSSIPLMTGSRT